MKKSVFFVVILLVCCLVSYHLGRASKQYNWDETSTVAVQTAAVSPYKQEQTTVSVNHWKPVEEGAEPEEKGTDVPKQQLITDDKPSEQLLADFTPLAESLNISPDPIIKTSISNENFVDELSEKIQEADDLTQLDLPSAEVAKETIAKLPTYILDEHLQRYFKPNDLGLIGDQYKFAQKLVGEYLDENPERTEQPSYPSTIHFSLTRQFNGTPSSDFYFSKNNMKSIIYAHLKMDPSVVNNSHIFVKWMNLTTGKIMLFNKKRISSQSDQNWVNLKPKRGWKPGAYKVKLYQFNTELTPIVEGQYSVYEIPEGSNLN